MDTDDYQEIRQLFDDYLRMYANRDDLLTTCFSEDFSGFTGGGDFLVKDRQEWVAITRQDFAQVKDPIRIELKDLSIQSLADTIAVTTGFFTIHLPIEDHILSRETARLVLIFRKESAGWKISHSSISIPYYLVREGEVYPLKELVDRNQFLEELIDERTIQLSEANANLQRTNEELAREIAEHKLVEEELNRKNIEIEQFIYTVSHDLRSPLVTVKSFLGYLQQDIAASDTNRIGKDVDFIRSAADRMEALLNELLDMAQIGRATTPCEPVTFQELVNEALDALAGQINTGRVDVRVSAADPTLCGDRRRLLQIWQNLLDNALKYMGSQSSPRIEIGIEQLQDDTVFFVCDNGIGIAPEYHEKVFGIFEKLDRRIGGVGMGLTMVKRIVEMYGGHIRLRSDGVAQGTGFYFTLPEALTGND